MRLTVVLRVVAVALDVVDTARELKMHLLLSLFDFPYYVEWYGFVECYVKNIRTIY